MSALKKYTLIVECIDSLLIDMNELKNETDIEINKFNSYSPKNTVDSYYSISASLERGLNGLNCTLDEMKEA